MDTPIPPATVTLPVDEELESIVDDVESVEADMDDNELDPVTTNEPPIFADFLIPIPPDKVTLPVTVDVLSVTSDTEITFSDERPLTDKMDTFVLFKVLLPDTLNELPIVNDFEIPIPPDKVILPVVVDMLSVALDTETVPETESPPLTESPVI